MAFTDKTVIGTAASIVLRHDARLNPSSASKLRSGLQSGPITRRKGAGRSARRFLRLLVPFCVGAAGVGFAMHNGLQVGISNHYQYLLHGMHAADPSFLAGDWFTTQTPEHHWIFGAIVTFLHASGGLSVGLGLLNGATALAFLTTLFFAVARFTRRPAGPFAAVMILAAFMPTNGPGLSHILLPYFVPSVFSGTCVFTSFVLLMYDRRISAGMVAGLGCLLHANYLVLVPMVWAVYILLAPRERRAGLGVALFVPWLIALIPQVPMILTVALDPAASPETRHIFWRVYAPMHYDPGTWPGGWYREFLLILIAGCFAAWLRRGVFTRTAVSIVAAVAIVVGAGAVTILLFKSALANSLFPWRLAPFLTIAAYIAIAMQFDGDSPCLRTRRLAACMITLALVHLSGVDMRATILLAAVFLVHILARMLDQTWRVRGNIGRVPEPIRQFIGVPLRLHEITLACCILVLALLGVRSGIWRKDMFDAPKPPEVRSLFEFCRTLLPANAVFAVPPEMTDFRLNTGRAIVVDFKSFPLTVGDQIEWMRRHTIQAGRPVTSFADANERYASLDQDGARYLIQEFGVRYVVIKLQQHVGDITNLPVVYQNARFAVVDLGSVPDTAPPSTISSVFYD